MEIVCTSLRKFGITHISNSVPMAMALAVVRTYEPDIIICDFKYAGHGWH